MSRKAVKRRSSIITIVIVLILIILASFFSIRILEKYKDNKEKDEKKQYISNLDEEDMMQYEYNKIDSTLDNLYAFAIKENFVVGVTSYDNFVNIYEINPEKEYDYVYVGKSMYILEKDTGIITQVSLKNIGQIEKTIELNCKVDYMDYYDKTLYYLSDGTLYKFEDGVSQKMEENITVDNFVIKNGDFYIVQNNDLVKISNGQKTTIANNVSSLNYYDYYERDRLIYDTSEDGINYFKNIYSYYTGEINNSIRNNTYFIPYEAKKYIYITNDQKSVIRVTDTGVNEYIYKAEGESLIKNIVFYKDGFIEVQEEGKNTIIELETKEVDSVDNITHLNNIRYIKITI